LIGNIFGGGFGSGFGGAGGGGNSRVAKGEDLKKIIEISFEESFLGTEKKISYSRLQKVEGVKEETCKACGGRGRVSQQVQTMFGVMQTQVACPTCQGYGKIFTKEGKSLTNGGLIETKVNLEIKIPAGIKDDAYLKYAGKGNAGIGGAPEGDLYLKIRVIPSTKYQRKGEDLYVYAEVSLFDLVLGGEIEIPHPEGKMQIKIPKGTQIGDKIRVGGKGFGSRGLFQSKGDLYVETKISIPKKLSKEEEALWKELQGIGK
jgi:molecular chaperone DnaJ